MDGPRLLKKWRTDTRKISQEEAAGLVNVHQNTWSDWENGRKTPRTEVALKLDVLTEGECPVEAWAEDDEVRDQWRAAQVTDGGAR
jgi:DNA-binding XRE family transcriptional regulator